MPENIESLVGWLHEFDRRLDATAIADTLWLSASMLAAGLSAATPPPPRTGEPDLPRPVEGKLEPTTTSELSGRLRNIAPTRGDPTGAQRGLPVQAPKGWSLSRQLDLSRSLRPFKRPWPVGLRSEIDLDATARQYARTHRLIPVFRAAPERWFNADVVVDDSASMTIWDGAVTEFTQLLHRVGAFRTIRSWQLTVKGSTASLRDLRGDVRQPDQLRSADHRRVILVLSDCSSDGWFTPAPWQILRRWAESTPTALINPLPMKLWDRTGLDLPAVRAGPGLPGCPNVGLRYRVPVLLHNAAHKGQRWVPLPAMALTPHSLERWAATLMRADPTGCDVLLIPPTGQLSDADNMSEDVSDDPIGPLSVHERVETFQLTASSTAVRLATLCAPLTQVSLPVLEIIGQTLVPEATTVDLAEVIVSGLFTVSNPNGHTVLGFRDGAQAALQKMLMVPEAWRTYEALNRYVAENVASTGRFTALVDDPVDDGQIPVALRPFAEASHDVLRLLTNTAPVVATAPMVAPAAPTSPPETTETPQVVVRGPRQAAQLGTLPKTSQVAVRGQRRASLVTLPEIPHGDLMVPVLDDPQVPEHKRFCPNPECRHQVGRARNGRPGQAKGFCPQCGTQYTFRPLLAPGTLVGAGQFEIEGAINHGGLGWVYRAWDRRVQRRVVLKGLIDPDDPDNRQAAVAELDALAKASHPNIVTVHTVVHHPHPLTGHDVDYIVMECLSGKSLKQLREERPDSDPYLPVHHVCGFALMVLAALGHLHVKRGLLHCDVSADNVIHSTSGVKLIDLGAVRRINDWDNLILWGKPGYLDPDIITHGPSVATDLYSVARMMAVLSFPFPGFFDDEPIPGPDEVELLARYPSFAGLLRRATNPDPHQRFASAADMAEQLEGVLREIRAVQEGRPFPATSTLFGPELRVVGADPDTLLTVTPDPVTAALALPDPQVDPTDPHAGLLAAISTESPDETERVLAALADPSLETRLRVVRARIELRRPDVGADLDALADQQPADWRVDWYRGLNSLVDGDVDAARQHFTAVLDALPGEAPPKLALAVCAAREGAHELAAQYFATVWQTDQSYVKAAFGLARARFNLGDIAGTAAALEAVPANSRYAIPARLCAILARARGYTAGRPPVTDFFTAAEQLATLELDDWRREQAIAEVLETVLVWEHASRPWPARTTTPIPATLLGHPLNERGVRDRLEAAYRKLAQLAPTKAQRITFVNQANDRRNRSTLRSVWRRIWS